MKDWACEGNALVPSLSKSLQSNHCIFFNAQEHPVHSICSHAKTLISPLDNRLFFTLRSVVSRNTHLLLLYSLDSTSPPLHFSTERGLVVIQATKAFPASIARISPLQTLSGGRSNALKSSDQMLWKSSIIESSVWPAIEWERSWKWMCCISFLQINNKVWK